jgi:hypothetical protein
MNDTLVGKLNKHGNMLRDAATVIQHQENDLTIAHRLLEEGAELKRSDDWDDWRNRVNDYLIRV